MTQISGIVSPPSNTSVADGTSNQAFLQGKQGEMLTAYLHGTNYTQAYRGNQFFATTATAGTTVPIQASSLVGTFVLLNPLGSGKNVELMRYLLGLLNATTVVSDVSLYFQTQIGSVNTALATTTALTSRACLLGGSAASQAVVYSAATFTGALTKGPTLVSFGATSTSNAGVIQHTFEGSIIVPPGCAVALAGNAAQTQAMQHTIFWNENPT